MVDLYDKSMYMSGYQAKATLCVYINSQQKRGFFLEFKLCDQSSIMKVLTYGGPGNSEYDTFSSSKKWTKIVLSKAVSLKNVRYFKFVLRFLCLSINDIPFESCLPRATLRFSFPIHEQVIL